MIKNLMNLANREEKIDLSQKEPRVLYMRNNNYSPVGYDDSCDSSCEGTGSDYGGGCDRGGDCDHER